jgi:hypothetical protein
MGKFLELMKIIEISMKNVEEDLKMKNLMLMSLKKDDDDMKNDGVDEESNEYLNDDEFEYD